MNCKGYLYIVVNWIFKLPFQRSDFHFLFLEVIFKSAFLLFVKRHKANLQNEHILCKSKFSLHKVSRIIIFKKESSSTFKIIPRKSTDRQINQTLKWENHKDISKD